MTEVQQIHFTSKYCKNGNDSNHYQCSGAWEGFNMYVVCECFCHNNKEAGSEMKDCIAKFQDNLGVQDEIDY